MHQNRTGIIKSQYKMMKIEAELKHLKIGERSQKSIWNMEVWWEM